ncbi:LOW QUALITY PROTEIN: UDP-glycosyltransferase UGT5-like [Cydia pomonella]|uniref:LOW QUALITY PROTEIN: UDP-glycosyltransferase UGT5-like n=1 Tax=Cydia pomonella TaxID=82600 RepID=UPI002ADE0794|nr:LOW QUALITY PROTEIN: UDP-glycosyltransferase UGT5-like [Cydia pomonella]
MRLSANIILISLMAWCCAGYRILVVFPLAGGKSHSILGEGVVRHLLAAGHDVTYIAGVPSKLSAPTLREIDVSSNSRIFKPGELCDIDKVLSQGKEIVFDQNVYRWHLMLANHTAAHEDVQRLMLDPKEEFDLVIIDWILSEILVGLSSVFNCPFIWLSSLEPHGRVLSLIDEWTDPTYVPGAHSRAIPPFTFAQRIRELFYIARLKYIRWQLMSEEQVLFERGVRRCGAMRGRQLPVLEDVKYNASLVLGNSHVAAGQATKLPQSYIPIAGFHIQDIPLPADLQRIMDDAKNGVIYFSMGSLLRAKRMPETLKQGLLAMLGSLRQTVIWKLEETPKNVPKNVHIVSFAPQQSILAHPNCILFITHGGLLSTNEALHFAVPILGVPVFGDQFQNVYRAVQKGFAGHVRLSHELPRDLKLAIQEIIGNPKYREKAKQWSFIYHDRRAPGSELVHWAEHVVRTRGAPHLRSLALLVPWYQKMYLDLLGLVFVIVLLCVFVVRRLVSKKIDVNKKNK